MEALIDVLSFTGKFLVATTALGGLFLAILFMVSRFRQANRLVIEDLNQKYQEWSDFLEAHFVDGQDRRKRQRKLKKKKSRAPSTDVHRRRVFVLDFQGDIRASTVDFLREEITAVLTAAKSEAGDEVLVRLESAGGTVHGYGLAAAQLLRLKNHGLRLTVAVDKMAASGGYMMACTADQILAAPFAILGSIGVLAQVPNFHRVLKKHDVDYEEVMAGDFKRTVSLLGEITPHGRQKFKEQVEETHALFKQFVKSQRPQVNLDQVATGEIWYGETAIAQNLVDRVQTSDDYLFHLKDEAHLLALRLEHKKTFWERLSESVTAQLLQRLVVAPIPTGDYLPRV